MKIFFKKVCICLTNIITYILADRMLYIWIFSLLSAAVAGGIILPTYLIAFDFDPNYPQFLDDLYSLNSSQNIICPHCKNCSLSDSGDCLLMKDNIVQKKTLHISNLEDVNKRRLYREKCIHNYNSVAHIILYLSLTFVIVAAFKSV